MTIDEITKILTEAPAKIAHYGSEELTCYELMLNTHEEYKRLRAKKYLEANVKGDMTQKEIEYILDCDEELNKTKDKENKYEIDYRSWRMKREKAVNYFDGAKAIGYIKQSELKSLGDVVKQP